MAPRGPQIDPKRPKIDQRGVLGGMAAKRCGRDGPKMAQKGRRRPQGTPQETPRRPPGGPKRPPGAPQEAPKRPPRGVHMGILVSRGPQEAPRRPPGDAQEAPRGPQDVPKRPQDAPQRAPGGPQDDPRGPQEAPKRPPRGPRGLPRTPPPPRVAVSCRSLSGIGPTLPAYHRSLPVSRRISRIIFGHPSVRHSMPASNNGGGGATPQASSIIK